MPRKPKIRRLMPTGNHNVTLIDIVDVPDDEKAWGDRWRFDFESDKCDADTGEKYRASQFTGQMLSCNTNLCKLLGWMTDNQWKALYEQLLKFDALPGPFDYQTAYTDRFLKAAYFESKVLWP